MKTIGLLGGMSWESTVGYYRAINEGIKREKGGLHSAKIAMVSVDFAPIEVMQQQGDWEGMAALLIEHGQQVEAAGADCLLICTNTMHRVADAVQDNIEIPLLHIADATASALRHYGIQRVGLLGTAFTMEQSFYAGRLADQHGLDVLTPDAAGRDIVHRIIYEELCLGVLKDGSRAQYLEIIASLDERGAEAVILGCTEIGLLVKQHDTPTRLFDTTAIHAEAAVAFALENGE